MCNMAEATVVDHIIPIADGGHEWDRQNLQPLCAPCHAKKDSKHEVCWHGYPMSECDTCMAARGGMRREDWSPPD